MYLFRGSKSSSVRVHNGGSVVTTPKVKHKSVDNLFTSFLARSMSKRNIASPERVPRKNNEFDTPSILSRSRSNAKGLESVADRPDRSRSTSRRSSDEVAESKSGRSKSTTKRNDWFGGDGGTSRSRSTAPVRNDAVADGGSSRSSRSISSRQSTDVFVLNDVTGAGGSLSARSKSTLKQRSSSNYNQTGGINNNNNSNKNNVETGTAAASSRSKSTTRRADASLDGGSSRSKSTTRRSDSADGGSSRSKSTTRRPEAAQVPQETLSRSTSRRSTIPIMFSNSNGPGKPLSIENTLECTLEELRFGSLKSVVISRDVLASNGLFTREEETLQIKITPGWRQGKKITFCGNRDERVTADVIFSIVEARHHLYTRDGDDLVMSIEIPLVQALTGFNLSIPLLGGENLSCNIDEVITPGYEKIIKDQGMPTEKNNESRGDLRIKVHVAFPGKLTQPQRSGLFSILKDSC